MSQGGIIGVGGGSGSGDVLTLTGNSGGAIGPDGVGNINVIGAGGVLVAGAGHTLTITAPGGGGFTWNDVAGTSATMVVNNGYVSDNAGLVTLTLPAVAAFGSVVRVSGKGDGGWLIAQNAGQQIIWDSLVATTLGVGGSLASTDQYDTVELLCITANTAWNVLTAKGNITVT